VRARVERLLSGRGDIESRRQRVERAVRVLEYAETPEARKCLEELARGGEDAGLRQAAGAALKRLDASARK
jgi:hypothetical protein